jgi:hypothetical protein
MLCLFFCFILYIATLLPSGRSCGIADLFGRLWGTSYIEGHLVSPTANMAKTPTMATMDTK